MNDSQRQPNISSLQCGKDVMFTTQVQVRLSFILAWRVLNFSAQWTSKLVLFE
jgi:hypothetical protein